ncbi:tetratricopeptide repeat protein, partial [Desulfobacterota bacterium AH_259_B03_O07]|nr:tetratricopeptide repeat protein [Desulfobacterota bacterium AH_259_B03_O07]
MATNSGEDNNYEQQFLTSKHDAYYHFTISMLYKNRRDITRAVEELELAESYDPDSALIKHNLALFYLSLNRFSDTVTKLEEAIAANPDYEPARALLGRIYASGKDPNKRKKGIEELEKSIDLNPNDIEAHLYLANIHTEEKEFDKAQESLMRVVELAPYDERGYYFLGRLYWLKGDLEESENYYESALKRNPYHPLALIELAAVYEKLGKVNESEEIYKNLINFYPLSLESYIR